ncbi:CENP-Q, a CENPA-CAD centromere complex subunit-domain-containing protein [Dipodascopsis tothii]|uniref:CENP-Q, a CENPA-CAD centromere complex subunit-domain-containing protein n=1 Tax=Dipodascopsis tothii TaxID=44089 RepID=UPI0034CDB10A
MNINKRVGSQAEARKPGKKRRVQDSDQAQSASGRGRKAFKNRQRENGSTPSEEPVGSQENKNRDSNAASAGRHKIEPVIHKIRNSVIRRDWVLLPDSAQREIIEMARVVSFPVLNSIANEKKKQESLEVIEGVLGKIARRLKKVPVPPNSKGRNFEYESIVASNADLESQLIPDMAQISVLESEIAAETAKLEEEQEYLQTITKNARSQASMRKAQQKKLASSLVESTDGTEEDSAEAINLASSNTEVLGHNDEIDGLTRRLNLHVNSIKSNFQDFEDILAEMKNVEVLLKEIV